MSEVFYIKAKRPDEKRFAFIGSGGSLRLRRVHACRWYSHEEARRAADQMAKDNPEFVFRIQPAGNGKPALAVQ